MRKQNFIQGAMVVVIISTIVKILSLVNRFFIARLLTPEGFSIYMLVMPTFMLLISFSQLGFPVSISKLVSENVVRKTLTNKSIILSATKITLINSSILITLLWASSHFLAHSLLNDGRAYYPLLALTLFIPLVAFSSILKAYLQGLKVLNLPAYSQLFEQSARILFSILFVIAFLPFGIEYAVAGSILALSTGELASIIFLLFRILNKKNIPYLLKKSPKGLNATKEILSLSLPVTGTRLIGSVTHFFEPIIFSFAMMSIGIGSVYTTRLYAQISGYVVSTLTVPTFVVISISQSLLPYISELHVQKKYDQIREFFNQSIFMSYVVGALFILILMIFPKEWMNLLFGTTEGTKFLILMAPFFILFYFEQPLQQTLQGLDQGKSYMLTTLFCNTLKLAMIYVLVSQRHLHVYGLIISMVVNIVLVTLTSFISLKKAIHLKIKWKTIVSSIGLFIITYVFGLFLQSKVSLHFILQTMIVSIFYLSILTTFNIGQIRALVSRLNPFHRS